MNDKKEILYLLREEYNSRLDMFINEVSVEYNGNVVLKNGLKLYDTGGCLWSVDNDEVFVNDKGVKHLILKKEGSLEDISLEENKGSDKKSGSKDLHPRTNTDKKSFDVKIDEDAPDLEQYLLKDNQFKIPFHELKRMFTL